MNDTTNMNDTTKMNNTTNMNDTTKNMTAKETKLFNIMKTTSGVLYLEGRPGEAKTAILENIARKNNMQFIDLRISYMDETDLGLYPRLNGDTVSAAVPEWAVLANEQPTIILFDELNRGQISQRNASFQILNERRIGYKFKFNKNVFMVAAGNQGDADGTTVDEFDSALWNRLIHVKHTMTFSEWSEGFAKENVVSCIHDYLQSHPEELYKRGTENVTVYASPRSWTFLSNYIRMNTNENALSDVITAVNEVGSSFIGLSTVKFIRYLNDQNAISINDILENYDAHSATVEKMNRSRHSELLTALKAKNFGTFNSKQIENCIKFLKNVHEDERMSYLLHQVDNENVQNDKVKLLLSNFKNEIQIMKTTYGLNKPETTKPETTKNKTTKATTTSK